MKKAKCTPKGKIQRVISASGRMNRLSCLLVSKTETSLKKTIGKMKKDGEIRVSKKSPWFMRLTKKGALSVKAEDETMYRYYMSHTSNNRPGSTKAHYELQGRASVILAMMEEANIAYGYDNSPVYVLTDLSSEEKLDVENEPAFILTKDILFSPLQQESRIMMTRATGILFSHGMYAAVYCCLDGDMLFNQFIEYSVRFQIETIVPDICRNPRREDITKSIVIGNSDEVCRQIAENVTRGEAKKHKRTFADAIRSRDVTGTDIIYLPADQYGITQLKLLSRYNAEEIKHIVFKKEELEAGSKSRKCDAIIKNLLCFELLTLNLSKLNWILKVYADQLDEIGLVCWEPQYKIINQLLAGKNVKLRVIKTEAVENLLRTV